MMSFNDGVTDCQPHSHALGLRGEEAFEDAVAVCRVKTNTGIRHVDDDVALIVELRTDGQDTWAVSDRTHPVDALYDEVEHDLLQLNPVRHDGRKLGTQAGLDGDAVSLQLGTGKRQPLRDRVIDIDLPSFRRGVF